MYCEGFLSDAVVLCHYLVYFYPLSVVVQENLWRPVVKEPVTHEDGSITVHYEVPAGNNECLELSKRVTLQVRYACKTCIMLWSMYKRIVTTQKDNNNCNKNNNSSISVNNVNTQTVESQKHRKYNDISDTRNNHTNRSSISSPQYFFVRDQTKQPRPSLLSRTKKKKYQAEMAVGCSTSWVKPLNCFQRKTIFF